MSMTVKRKKDTMTPRVMMHKIADVRGGVSVSTSELGGDFLREGAVISAPVNGICHVVKIASVKEAVLETGTEIKVSKFNNFRVDDNICTGEDGKAVKITKIDTGNKGFDLITVSEAIGGIPAGEFVIEASGASEKAVFKYKPFAIVGTGKPVVQDSNLDTDAWLFAVTKGNPLPGDVSKHLPGIINY